MRHPARSRGQRCEQWLTTGGAVSAGLALGPASEAATCESRAGPGPPEARALQLPADSVDPPPTGIETRPSLWAESASPLKPWAQLKLTCGARLATLDFQLLKGGVALERVHLDTPAIAHQFVLGEVGRDNQGLYHCRAGLGEGWTQLSDLVEVTGTGEQGAAFHGAQRPSRSFPCACPRSCPVPVSCPLPCRARRPALRSTLLSLPLRRAPAPTQALR